MVARPCVCQASPVVSLRDITAPWLGAGTPASWTTWPAASSAAGDLRLLLLACRRPSGLQAMQLASLSRFSPDRGQ